MRMHVRVAGLVCAVFLMVSNAAGDELSLAPDFSLKGLDGIPYTLSDYRGKQPVLLLFWTTWCPYCRKALKSTNEMSQELRDSNILVLAVNVSESEEKISTFMKYTAVPFAILRDEDSKISHAYNLMGVPTYVLIDKQGSVAFKGNSFPRGKFKQLLEK